LIVDEMGRSTAVVTDKKTKSRAETSQKTPKSVDTIQQSADELKRTLARVMKSANITKTVQILGWEDPSKLASGAPGHHTYNSKHYIQSKITAVQAMVIESAAGSADG
jgi:hypothetical protein